MSIEVKCFDEKGAEAELAKCPQIVKDYVKKLKSSRDSWKDICAEAVNKLRNASKNNGVLHGVSNSVCPKCGNTGRTNPTLSDPDDEECDCD